MRIGIDFDNTIVNYNGVFYKAGRRLEWLPKLDDESKQAVKSYFVSCSEEPRWTELQGIVYGYDIRFAKPYEGIYEILGGWKDAGHQMFLVSHKTKYPIIGHKVDFHQAATNWLKENNLMPYFEETYFCPQKDEKVEMIEKLELDYFIDDLPSILNSEKFPQKTHGVLFSPDNQDGKGLRSVSKWAELLKVVC
jgi:phosphoglycolate phosphatase-like HAD superfamily hydrolase